FIYLNQLEYKREGRLNELDNEPALVTRHWYDNNGRCIATLNADNYLTAFAYYANGQIKEEITFADKQDEIDRKSSFISIPKSISKDRTITYIYDEVGRKKKITNSQTQLAIELKYDNANNEIERTLTDLKTASIRRIRKKYNAYSELTQSSD